MINQIINEIQSSLYNLIKGNFFWALDEDNLLMYIQDIIIRKDLN